MFRNALTQKQMVDRYYMAPLQTLELKKDGKIVYGGESELITGKIIEIDAPKKLVHSFVFADRPIRKPWFPIRFSQLAT